MATWLNDYKNRKLSLEPLLQRGKMTVQELLVYQELLYRIQILETCQSLCKTAPVSVDMKELLGHSPLQVIMGALLGIAIGLLGTIFFK